MARPRRIQRIGAYYHLRGRGNQRRTIFREDRNRQHLGERLAEMVELFGIRLPAFVLRDNHHHRLVELRELNLSRASQWLKGSASLGFHRRHARGGHV